MDIAEEAIGRVGGHSLQGFVHGFLGCEKKTRRWPAGSGPCVCVGIFGEPEGRVVCVCAFFCVSGPNRSCAVRLDPLPEAHHGTGVSTSAGPFLSDEWKNPVGTRASGPGTGGMGRGHPCQLV